MSASTTARQPKERRETRTNVQENGGSMLTHRVTKQNFLRKKCTLTILKKNTRPLKMEKKTHRLLKERER